MIVPDGEKKVKLHTRVSTICKTLEDTYRLELWGLRTAAIGFTKKPDLLARVAACRPDDRDTLDKMCEKAKEAAGSDEKANLGTALHEFAERVNLGEEVEIPEPYAADIAAYQATLSSHGVEIVPGMVELTVVLPELVVAGTFDRIVDFGSKPKICDIKTGDIRYKAQHISMQGALYAHAATLYDWTTETHRPMPDVDQDVMLLVHLPVGEARCDLYWVDIAAGWEAVEHAMWARAWRKRDGLMKRWDEGTPVVQPDVRRVRLTERIRALEGRQGAIARLSVLWPEGTPRLSQATVDDLDSIAMAVSAVEAEFRMPFGPLDPAKCPDLNRTPENQGA
jgi:hypothetical protein